MEHANNKKARETSVKNICCIGCSSSGLYTCCVIANMCPNLKVAVVDFDKSKIMAWNTRKIPSSEPGLEKILRKCQNKNLIFTTETENAIKEADIVFLSLNNGFSETGRFKGVKTANMEEAARLIGKVSNTSKIIVEKSTMPVGCVHFMAYVLDQNRQEGARFQVLTNPDFCSVGEVIEYLANPDRILIGSAMTSQGLAAAETLLSIYTKWIPREKILLVNAWSAELGKLAMNAFLAQKLSTVSALSLICEATNKTDVSEILNVYSEVTGNPRYLEPSFRFGGKNLQKDMLCLIFMCRELKLTEMADYWQSVLDMNEFHMKRFKNMILSEFYETLVHKKIAILGFSYKKGITNADNSPASYLCKNLLSEGAQLVIYDPGVEKRHIIQELQNINSPYLEANVSVAEDAYKAAAKANAVVFCTDWDEFKTLDFATIYKNMIKPAYIFDGRKFLPHQSLIDMDFVVKTIGTNLKQKQHIQEEDSWTK